MAQLDTKENQKTYGYMSTKKNKNQERIEREEKELAELEAQLTKSQEEDSSDDEEDEQEEPQEAPKEAKQEEPTDPEEKSFKKRYGDLRRHMQEKEKQWKDEREKLLQGQSQEIRPPASDEDLAAWKQKYPDVAAIVETVAMQIADKKFQDAKMSLEEIRGAQEQSKVEKGLQAIRNAHPDFDELQESDKFHNWLESQTQWIQDAMFENTDDPKAAIRVLDLYKIDNGLTPAAKKEQSKEAIKEVKAKSRPDPDAENASKKWRESKVAKMSDRDYEKHEAEIMEAMSTGNFIYDLSGGAR